MTIRECVPLADWIALHQPATEMYWARSALTQFDVFADIAREAAEAVVVSTHRSKSITLPVVVFRYANGAKVQVRDNFYDYKVTVCAPAPVALPSDIQGHIRWSECYCEGFPAGTVLGSHVADSRRFTVEVCTTGLLVALCRAATQWTGWYVRRDGPDHGGESSCVKLGERDGFVDFLTAAGIRGTVPSDRFDTLWTPGDAPKNRHVVRRGVPRLPAPTYQR